MPTAEQPHQHSKAVVEKLAAQGRAILEQGFKDCTLQDNRYQYPKVASAEVKIGKKLGQGGFSTVFEVTGFEIPGSGKGAKTKEDDEEIDGMSGREVGMGEKQRIFLADHCLRDNGDSRYCLKRLSPNVVAVEGDFLTGMIDLATETRILSDIMHTNIVKLRAIAKTPNNDPFSEDYFLVMDRLYDTLETRIYKKWQKSNNFQKSAFGKVFDLQGKKKDKFLEQRLAYAYDLSAAINYLHKRNIIYRDLKPENLGFDIRDDIKLFDFGLSRELKDEVRAEGTRDLYNLTKDTGSPRYMAPEVGLGKPYNQKCDTYSFCIVLWEMLALKSPYELYTVKKLVERVYSDMAKRPLVDTKWPATVKQLLKDGWTNNVQERITMDDVERILRKEMIDERGGDESRLSHTRRRSTFVMEMPSTADRKSSKIVRSSDFANKSNTMQMKISEDDELCMSDSESEDDSEDAIASKSRKEEPLPCTSKPVTVDC